MKATERERLVALALNHEHQAHDHAQKAQGIRYALSVTDNFAQEKAEETFPIKLKQAVLVRAGRTKGALIQVVREAFGSKSSIPKRELIDFIKTKGYEGRGLGAIYRADYIRQDRKGIITLGARGRRLEASATVATKTKRGPYKKRRKSHHKTAATNGSGPLAQIAEIVREHSGPITATEIITAAKARGFAVLKQTLGQATRHGVLRALDKKGVIKHGGRRYELGPGA